MNPTKLFKINAKKAQRKLNGIAARSMTYIAISDRMHFEQLLKVKFN